MDESEFFTFRVILTALVRDFHFPCVRFTSALALTTYMLVIETRYVSEENKEIATLELALLKKHLMEDELKKYDEGLAVIIGRWAEYIADPENFKL